MTGVRRRLSAWSVIAIVLSIGLCPVVTAAAIPAGLWALWWDVRVHHRRGRRLAIVAIVIGVICTPITTTAAFWWNSHVRVPLLDGPAELIAAGQRGDVTAFLAGTAGGGSQANATAFLTELTGRLGILQSTRPSEQPGSEQSSEGDDTAAGWWIWVPYDAMFEGAAVTMRARFLLSDPDRGWVTAFDRFEVDPPDGPPLRWPPVEPGP